MSELTVDIVTRALSGDREACRALARVLGPVIHGRVAKALTRSRSRGRFQRTDVEDIVQTIWVTLFANEGRPLRKWDPARLPLEGFIAVLADREVMSILRSRRRNPWTEEPTSPEDIEPPAGPEPGGGPERMASSRERLRAILTRLRAGLTRLGWEMFTLLHIEGRSVPEICALTGMEEPAVHAWSSRIAKLARELDAKL